MSGSDNTSPTFAATKQTGTATRDCELSILVARPDVNFMMRTVPHLVAALRYPFRRRLLVVDTAPLSGKYRLRTDVPPLAVLHRCCDELIRLGVMDEAVPIDYTQAFRRAAYRKHLDSAVPIALTHDCGGYPVLGSIFYIEEAKSQYLLHFDSDMLLYQHSAFNWVEEGIRLLRRYEDIMAVLPLSGPPSPDGNPHQDPIPYERDGRGFFRFKHFTSRCFLIDTKRFEKLLPLRGLRSRRAIVKLIPPKMILSIRAAMGKNGLWPWEEMVSDHLENSAFVRADLQHPGAWTLHPDDHGPEFVAHLPAILEKLERGFYPTQQAGYYDLRLTDWISS